MTVYKCDKCGKELSDEEKNLLEVHTRYKRYEFCVKCSEPIAQMLNRYKLTTTYE